MIVRLILPVLICFSTAVAFAQGATTAGDGGHGVLCRNHNGTEIFPRETVYFRYTMEALDLFEARTLYKVHGLRRTSNIVGDAVSNRVMRDEICRHLEKKRRRLNSLAIFGLNSALTEACNLSDSIRFAKNLVLTADHGGIEVRIPNNCDLVQLALRDKSGTVWINHRYSMYLNKADLAAILLHEALHELYPKKTSTKVLRQIVMSVFAHREFQIRNRDVIQWIIDSGEAVPRQRFR